MGAPSNGGAVVVVPPMPARVDVVFPAVPATVVVVFVGDDLGPVEPGVVVGVVVPDGVVVAVAPPVDVVVPALVVVVTDAVVVVVAGDETLQVGDVIVLSSSVTAPFWASARPSNVAPVFIEIDAKARMLPTNEDVVPMVAELPTCQKMLQAWTPPDSTTRLPDPVMSVLTAWKMKTEFALPTKVNVPVSDMLELAE
jgi:hypothetical protein